MTHFVSHFLTNWGRNKDKEEKNSKNKFDLLFLHIKIRIYGNFHENLRKKWNEKVISLFHYSTLTVWWRWEKSWYQKKKKNEDEKISKNEFEFWILHAKIKLCDNFHKNLRRKQFDPFFNTFLTNRGKNGDVIENFLENEFDLWILHI